MKAKQAEKLLTGVMNNFLESINDSEIKTIIKERSYITGGCIPSMLMGEFVNDYDIYFYTKEDAEKIKDYYQRQRLDSSFIPGTHKFECKLITENAINLSDKIQLIIKFVGTPEEVTEKFDWQHIKSYYLCKQEKLFLKHDIYRLICEKELIYTGSDYPLSSLMRLKKYIKKGWNVSNTTILHITLDIVASFNKMEADRQFEQAKHRREQLEKINQKIKDMSQKKYDNCDCNGGGSFQEDFKVIADPVELNFINKMIKVEREQTFNVEDIIYHLNGVDPLTIQAELQTKAGQYLSINEIIKIMKGE